MSLTMHTATERPDLWERGIESDTVWPEYNLHGDVLNQWWGLLDEELRDFQFVLYDDAADDVVAEGRTGPFRWDGHEESLAPGIDAVIELIFRQHRPARHRTRCVHWRPRRPGTIRPAVWRRSCWARCAPWRSGRD